MSVRTGRKQETAGEEKQNSAQGEGTRSRLEFQKAVSTTKSRLCNLSLSYFSEQY